MNRTEALSINQASQWVQRPDAPQVPAVDTDGRTTELEQQGLQIDFRQIWTILRRNALFIAGIVVVALLISLAATLLMTPRYVATASVQIDQEAARVLDTDSVEPTVSYQDADRFLQTQVDVLNSRAMASRVAQALNLFNTNRIFEAMQVTVPEPVQGVARKDQVRNYVLYLIQTNLRISLPRESRVVSIAFVSPDARFATQVANTFASEFIRNNLQRKYDSSNYAREFLSQQLAETKTRLETSERDLNAYARSAGLIKTSDPGVAQAGPRSITTASLVQLNQAANDAKAARVAAEQKWRTTSTTPLMNSADVLGNPAVQTLLQRQAELGGLLSQEEAQHRDTYPTVVAMKAQIAQVTDQLRVLAENIRSSVRDQYEVALRQEQSLNSQVRGLMGDTLSEQDRSVRYNVLQREADTNRTLYDGLLQRYKEVSAAAGVTTNNISIVDSADEPTQPSSPKLLMNLLLGMLAGAALAVVLVFIREQVDDAVRVPEDLERKLGIPVLGAIPLARNGEDMLELLKSPRSNISEAYHAVRTSILYSSVEGLPHTLLITSSQSGEGKSTTSFAIAADLARLDQRVLLVDVDLRRPSLHRLVDVPNDVGLSSVLAGQAALDDAVRPTEVPNLTFLPSGPIPPSPTELLGSLRMRDLLDHLGGKFDVVVLDGPPVLGLADAPILAALAEATIFVIESNRGYRGATKRAVRRLHSAHSRLIGGILTKFDPRKSGDSQYYGYEYYYYGVTDQRKRADADAAA